MAAMTYVGSITDCDLPKLREAAIEAGMKANPKHLKAVAAETGCPEKLAHEMWMRHQTHRYFDKIMADAALGRKATQKLKDFLFQLLYPLQ